jgi:hypothetical protein
VKFGILSRTFVPRTVQNNLLLSRSFPAARFQIDPQFTYVGNTSFILYDVAHVEQHHFVVSKTGKRVQRLLWFQFEGYLDNNEYTYKYSGMETMRLRDLTFLHDADVLNIDDDYKERPTSDSAHVIEFLKQKGYTLEGDTMFKRMVWLDASLRNELMIIYSEDLRSTGIRAKDLAKDGANADEWSAISKDLHMRALAGFAVE